MSGVLRFIIAAAACGVSGAAIANDLAALGLDAPGPAGASKDGLAILGLQDDTPPAEPATPAPRGAGPYGGGLIEFLVTGGAASARQPQSVPPATASLALRETPDPGAAGATEPAAEPAGEPEAQFRRQEVDYMGGEAPGTIVIDTIDKFLFLVEPRGRALRYGVGVGRPGFEWSGVKRISRKSEWPDWTPPAQMLLRRPDLPRHMAGGPDNPLGARALYLGSSLYRIHGTNQPQTIGHAISSGCFRLVNEDVIDLYDRVPVGTKVIIKQAVAL